MYYNTRSEVYNEICGLYGLLPLLFQYHCVDYGYGGDVDDVAYGTFEVGEVDGFVKPHLDWTDDFAVVRHALDHLITAVG